MLWHRHMMIRPDIYRFRVKTAWDTLGLYQLFKNRIGDFLENSVVKTLVIDEVQTLFKELRCYMPVIWPKINHSLKEEG